VPETIPTPGVRFGVFEFDPASGELRKAGLLVHLPPQPARVLALLLGRAGQVVTREELQRQIWGEDTFVDFERGLNFCIKQIRDALEDDADVPRFVETLPKRGYRFVASVEKLAPLAAVAPAEAAPLAPRPRPRRFWAPALAGLLVLTVAGYLAWRGKTLWPSSRTDRVMLLVLPFENLSGDPAQEYFSDGLTEEMITQLSRLQPERLAVLARTTAMHYKGRRQPAEEIGRETRAQYILEGSVRRASDRLRISAQLIAVRDQAHLWAQSYDRPVSDILVVQSDIARAVAREIELALTPQQQAQLAAVRPLHPQAHEAYLKGRFTLDNSYTREGLQKALAYFQQAIELDPLYAPAYVGLAETYYGFSNLYMAPKEAMPRVRAAAQRALEVDDTLADAHVWQAVTLGFYDRDWAAAAAELRRAIQLNPSSAPAHLYSGFFLTGQARFDEAQTFLQRARELDPLSINISVYSVLPLYMGRRYEDAAAQLQTLVALDPDYYLPHAFLGLVYEQTGQVREAVAEFEKTVRLDDTPEPLAQLAYAYARAGELRKARQLLATLLQRGQRDYVSPYNIAIILVGLGEDEQALAWLEKAVDDRSEWVLFLGVDPRLDALRAHPRFQALLDQVGLKAKPRAARKRRRTAPPAALLLGFGDGEQQGICRAQRP